MFPNDMLYDFKSFLKLKFSDYEKPVKLQFKGKNFLVNRIMVSKSFFFRFNSKV
jgi:hypothetical protein